MLCLVTRIRVRRVVTLAWIVVEFVRMRRRARHVPGLIDSWISLRGGRTAFLISLWECEGALLDFNRVVSGHPDMVRWMDRERAEVWSGYFRFAGASPRSRWWRGSAQPDVAQEKVANP